MALQIASPPKGFEAINLGTEAQTVMRKQIDARHPDWKLNQDKWANVALMYEGGDAIKRCADRFLKRRPKEDQTVFTHRIDQFTYENNLGAGLGWHEAQMFVEEPTIDIKVKDAAKDAALPKDADDFYNQKYLKDCDKHGTTFVDQFRKVFTTMLLYGEAFVSTDLPVRGEDVTAPQTLQAERDGGFLDPYTCVLTPLDVINWNTDEHGNLLWAVVYSRTEQQQFLKPPVVIERWYWYDRTQYRVYEARHDAQESSGIITDNAVSTAGLSSMDKTPVKMILAGHHPLAGKGVVPLQRVCVPAGWYMGNRAYLPALEHINISNALKWSLFMAALAVPVLITDDEVASITVSEVGYIKLGIGSDYKFAEPSGNCWKELAARAKTLTEEIWRALYLVAQARSTNATASAQSGVSKQQDMQPSHDVLNGLGDVLRAAMQETLGRIAAARALCGFSQDETLTFDVRGFSFEDKLGVEEVSVCQDLLALEIPSDTLEKELMIKIASAALPDMNPDTRAIIIDEIKKAPAKQERDINAQLAQDEATRTHMEATMKLGMPEGIAA